MKTIAFLLFTTLGLTFSACSQAQNSAGEHNGSQTAKTDLGATEFQAQIGQDGAVLLDVRTRAEYESGHLAGSMNMDWTANDYEKAFATLDPKKPVLVYCASGGRSDQAKEYLVERGYRVTQLMDGISGWKKAGLPVVKD